MIFIILDTRGSVGVNRTPFQYAQRKEVENSLKKDNVDDEGKWFI